MDIAAARSIYHSKSAEERLTFLQQLSPQALESFVYSPAFIRPDQVIPFGDWRYCIALTGRGFGKTVLGAQWIADKVHSGAKELMCVGATYSDIETVMVPAILKRFAPSERPIYIKSPRPLIRCFGFDIPCITMDTEAARGINAEFCWIDEIVKACDAKEDKIVEHLAMIDFAVRIGKSQILITTTPKRMKFIRRWQERAAASDPSLVLIAGTMDDNPFLSFEAKAALRAEHGETRFGNQELNGIIDWQTEGALWSPELLNRTRIRDIESLANPSNPNNVKRYNHPYDFFKVFIIGVDPATTNNSTSAEWGVFVAGLGKDNHIYIIQDSSRIMSPNEAVEVIAKLHSEYRNPFIVAETNQGGGMVEMVIRTKLPNAKLKLIHAHQSKMTRAQPVSILFEQGRAHLVGSYRQLEEELCNYTGDEKEKSPNRMDAMVYACQFGLLEPNTRPGTSYLPNFR